MREYNNWWQLKWDCLGEEADPLEAQEAEPGVKERGAEPVVNQSGSGKRDSAEREEKESRRSYQEHRAESQKHQSSRQLAGREPRATAADTGPRAER